MRRLIAHKARFVVLALGICLALTLLVSWRTLLVGYYVHRLRAEPEYAWELVEDAEEIPSTVDAALRRFLADAKAKEWFVERLWMYVVEPLLMTAQTKGRNVEAGVVFMRRQSGAMACFRLDNYTVMTTSGAPADPERSRKCFTLASRMTCRRLSVPKSPSWSVTVTEPEPEEFEALNIGASFPEHLSWYVIVRPAEQQAPKKASSREE